MNFDFLSFLYKNTEKYHKIKQNNDYFGHFSLFWHFAEK